MEQAATIDGCNRVHALLRILLPVAAPGIVTALIFVFINAWNEYTVALTLISTDTFKPLTVGINIFNGYNMIEWQYLFAASLYAIVPVVILFVGIEKNSGWRTHFWWCQGLIFIFLPSIIEKDADARKGLPRAALCSCPVTIQKAVFRQVFL